MRLAEKCAEDTPAVWWASWDFDATAGTSLERRGVHALGTQSTWFFTIYNQTFRVCWANDPLRHYSWDVARPLDYRRL